ncbi:efflux RND transporter periplasmic adaptor subunit [Petrachloros mirabilis]
MEKIRWTAQIGVVIFALFMFATACSDRESGSPPRPATVSPTATLSRPGSITPPKSVQDRLRTEPVSMRVVPELVTAPGEVALDLKQVAKITSRIEGQVQSVHVQLGDRIEQGQPLVAIDSMRLDELVQEYLVTKAQADVAVSGYRRTEKLAAEKIVTERRLIEERGRAIEAKARYQHVREKLLNMGMNAEELHQLEHGSHQEGHLYTIRSPIRGTVISQNVVRGQGVSPGIELFEIVDTTRVWVFANLPIEQARKFKEGDVGTIIPKSGESVTAPLTYLAPVADEATRTVRVRFEIDNVHHRLRPREYVDVQLTFEKPPTLAVPASAPTMVDNVQGVFVKQDKGYAFTPIDTGREAGGWVEVTGGLAEGQQVVVGGVFDLKNVLLKEHIGSGEDG